MISNMSFASGDKVRWENQCDEKKIYFRWRWKPNGKSQGSYTLSICALKDTCSNSHIKNYDISFKFISSAGKTEGRFVSHADTTRDWHVALTYIAAPLWLIIRAWMCSLVKKISSVLIEAIFFKLTPLRNFC